MVPKPLQKLDGDSPLMSIVAQGGIGLLRNWLRGNLSLD